MDGLYGEDATSKGGERVTNPLVVWRDNLGRKLQHFLDKSTPHPVARWIASFVVAAIYCLRAYYIEGFYIVTYGLGIYLLNLLIGFLSPQVDPESEGPGLPSKETDEFKPFIRRLPEFKFWYALTKAFLVAFSLTFFGIFDVPVFWPILLLYWLVLFVLTMKRQIRHMIKYRYIPFTVGKQGVSKGVVVEELLAMMALKSASLDFMLCVGDVCLDEDTFEAIAVGMSAGPPKYVSEPSGHIRGRVSRRQGNTSLEALKVRRSINPSGRDGKLPFEGVGR